MNLKIFFTILALATTSVALAQLTGSLTSGSGASFRFGPATVLRNGVAVPVMDNSRHVDGGLLAGTMRGANQAIQDKAKLECRIMFNDLKSGSTDPGSVLIRTAADPAMSLYANTISLMNGLVNDGLVSHTDNEIVDVCIPRVQGIYARHMESLSGQLSGLINDRGPISSGAKAIVGNHTIIRHEDGATEVTNSSCVINRPIGECRVDNSVTPATDLAADATMAAASNISKFSPADCECAENNYQSESAGRPKIADDKKALEARLNDLVIKSFGKKFINDYAANIENIDYFLNDKAEVFMPEGIEDDKEAGVKYQCNKEAGYRQKIEQACKTSKITPAEREARIKSMLSAFGKPEFTNFEEHMKKIAEDVLTRKPASTAGAPVTSERYSRFDFDGHRAMEIGLNKGIAFADRAAARVMSTPELRETFSKLTANDVTEEAFIKILADEALKSSSVVSDLLMSPGIQSSIFSDQLKAVIATKDVSKIQSKLRKAFTDASRNHPGFKLAMTDKNKLSEFAVATGSDSLIRSMESQRAGGFLDSKFSEQCENLQEKFAEAVCTDNEKLLPQVPAEDLANIVAETDETLNDDLNVFKKILCEKNGKPSEIFNGIDVDHLPLYSRSDYLETMLADDKHPAQDYFSIVANLASGKSPEGHSAGPSSALGSYVAGNTASRLRGDSNGYTGSRSTSSSDSRLANQFIPPGAKADSQTITQSRSIASTTPTAESSKSAQLSDRSVVKDEVQGNTALASNIPNTNVAIPSGGAIPSVYNNLDSKKDARSELREAISNDSNKENVEKLVSNIDDSSAKELTKLREESLRNQQKLLELSSEAETNKLKDLERRIKELQTARAEAVRNESENEDESLASNKPKRTKSKFNSRDVAEDGSFDELPSTQNQATSGSGNGATSGSSTSAGAGRANITASSANSSNAVRPVFSNAGALVISSNALLSQDIKPQELNNELLKYLNQNEQDISTLMNIKTSGMVYKFKVMENGTLVEKEIVVDYSELNQDIKVLIEQKIAKNKGIRRSVASIDEELAQVKRTHSYLALKGIIQDQVRR